MGKGRPCHDCGEYIWFYQTDSGVWIPKDKNGTHRCGGGLSYSRRYETEKSRPVYTPAATASQSSYRERSSRNEEQLTKEQIIVFFVLFLILCYLVNQAWQWLCDTFLSLWG